MSSEKSPNKRDKSISFLIVAVCFILYGIRIMMIHSGTKFYRVWYVLGFLFFILFYIGKKHLWAKVPKKIRKITYIILSLLLALFLVVEGAIMTHFFDKGEDNLDYIIVLGAQIKEDGPSYVLKRRLDAALSYLYENPDTICVVSGGQGYNEPFPEADGMAFYLESNGIDSSRIIKEATSSSTEENILNSMELIDCDRRIGIVSNNFHVFRAVKTAEKCGLRNVCGIAGQMSIIFLPNNMLREFLAVLRFYLVP